MTKQEILPGVIDYFGGDELAANVWIDKYALKLNTGVILEKDPDDMHRRLAKAIARIEAKYPNPMPEEYIFDLLKGFRYIIPGGSPMTGVGSDLYISLSNCFVIEGAEDSYGGIMIADEEQIQLMKRRGGVGHDLSKLRPSGAIANNSVLKGMSGSVLYAERFSRSTKEVRQGDRRGALMLSMSIVHPDAENFIDAKLEDGRITDANISVRITDEFMESVLEDGDFFHYFPIDIPASAATAEFPGELVPYDQLLQGCNGGNVYIKRIKAKRLWDKIITNSWKSAEPGVLFWDTILRESPADCYPDFKTKSTNPCGEIPLCPYDSCRLSAINLFSYVVNPFEPSAYFDFGKFRKHSRSAQRIMDDIIDLELEKISNIILKIMNDPEDIRFKQTELELWHKVYKKTLDGRRTGLGITGEGDMLAALGFIYGSDEAIEMSKNVHKVLAVSSYTESIYLAAERGCFQAWSAELENKSVFIDRILWELPMADKIMYHKFGRRNISNLTIAPTGTVSILTQTTSGVEPCFMISYTRRRRSIDPSEITYTSPTGETFTEYKVFHHKFVEWYDKNWFRLDHVNFDLGYHKPLENYTDEELAEIIKKSPYNQACAYELNSVNRIRMQAGIQKWVDHSISSTINLPKDATVEDVGNIFILAYKLGCKGITIYREGSRSGILVSSHGDTVSGLEYIDAVKRPKKLEADIYHKSIKKDPWTVVVGKFDNKPYEIFAFPGISYADFPHSISKGEIIKERSGVYKLVSKNKDDAKVYTIDNMVDLLSNDDGTSTRKFSLMLRHHVDPKFIIKDIEQYANITSFDKAIQRVLKCYVTPEEGICPECGDKITNADGCVKCVNCGWSKCS